MDWNEAERLHAAAVSDLASAAERVPEPRWRAARAEGKWSPAEIVEHLSLTFDVLLRELEGGGGMKILTKPWQRILLRITMAPRILRGGAFPKGTRAPRELRPAMPSLDQRAAIAAFREKAARFSDAAAKARAARPRTRLTHPYFGRSSLANAFVLAARHIEHHRKQLSW